MKILKYLILFFILYLFGNISFWSYQEYIYYDDVKNIKNLGNIINIAKVTIEEKRQSIDRDKKNLEAEKLNLDKLLEDKKYVQYNELVKPYNDYVDKFNQSTKEYEILIEIHNQNVRTVNELIIKYGTRRYLFPLGTYTPELYREIN